jgi:hypothetical protein
MEYPSDLPLITRGEVPVLAGGAITILGAVALRVEHVLDHGTEGIGILVGAAAVGFTVGKMKRREVLRAERNARVSEGQQELF